MSGVIRVLSQRAFVRNEIMSHDLTETTASKGCALHIQIPGVLLGQPGTVSRQNSYLSFFSFIAESLLSLLVTKRGRAGVDGGHASRGRPHFSFGPQVELSLNRSALHVRLYIFF